MKTKLTALLLSTLFSLPVLADKPEWAGNKGKPSAEQREAHSYEMKNKHNDQYRKEDKNQRKHEKKYRDDDDRHEHDKKRYKDDDDRHDHDKKRYKDDDDRHDHDRKRYEDDDDRHDHDKMHRDGRDNQTVYEKNTEIDKQIEKGRQIEENTRRWWNIFNQKPE